MTETNGSLDAAKPPHPGSQDAISRGCTCPVIDNGHGKGYMGQPGIYVMHGDCPLHGEKEKEMSSELKNPHAESSTNDWRLYDDPYHRHENQPYDHEWIEIKRDGDLTGKVIRIRYANLHPAMNVWGLWWRPAKAPETQNEAR